MPGGYSLRLKQCPSLLRSSVCLQRRLKTTYEVLKGDQLGPVTQEGHQTFRIRKDGRPLPLPPLLDPVVLEERSRWNQTKAKPDVNNFTPFQKKLWETPYAHALASPVRQCRFTGSLMPSDLLLPLTPRINPTTSDPWLLPVSLTTTSKQLGTSLKISIRKPMVAVLTQKKQWIAHLDRRTGEKIGRPNLGRVVWREDMPDFVLTMMRKQLLNKLRWHVKHPGCLVPCASPRAEDIEGVDDVSCILYFGSLKTIADEVQEAVQQIVFKVAKLADGVADATKTLDSHSSKSVTHTPPYWWSGPLVPRLQPRAMFPPLEFKTTQWRGSRVAIYSLHDLMGEDNVKELIRDSRFSEETCLAVKRARHNVPVELLLMQMQTYLAAPGP